MDNTLEEEDKISYQNWEGYVAGGVFLAGGRGGSSRTLGWTSTTLTWPAKQATAGPLMSSRRAACHRGGGGGQYLGGGGPNLLSKFST